MKEFNGWTAVGMKGSDGPVDNGISNEPTQLLA